MFVDFVDVPKETNSSVSCCGVVPATLFRIDVHDGHVTHKVVAEALQLP